MRIKAALYNARHLEYGLVTIPFPIPQDQYTGTIKMLEALDIGGPRARDCMIEKIEGNIPSIKCLERRKVNLDELDGVEIGQISVGYCRIFYSIPVCYTI